MMNKVEFTQKSPAVENFKSTKKPKGLDQKVEKLFELIKKEHFFNRPDKDGFFRVSEFKSLQQCELALTNYWKRNCAEPGFLSQVFKELNSLGDVPALPRIQSLVCTSRRELEVNALFRFLLEKGLWEEIVVLIKDVKILYRNLTARWFEQICQKNVPLEVVKRIARVVNAQPSPANLRMLDRFVANQDYGAAAELAQRLAFARNRVSWDRLLFKEANQSLKYSLGATLLIQNLRGEAAVIKAINAAGAIDWEQMTRLIVSFTSDVLAPLYSKAVGESSPDSEAFVQALASSQKVLFVLPKLQEQNRVQLEQVYKNYLLDCFHQKWYPEIRQLLVPTKALQRARSVWEYLSRPDITESFSYSEMNTHVQKMVQLLCPVNYPGRLDQIPDFLCDLENLIQVLQKEFNRHKASVDLGKMKFSDWMEHLGCLLPSMGQALIFKRLLKNFQFCPNARKKNEIVYYAAHFLLDGLGAKVDDWLPNGLNSESVLPHFLALLEVGESIDEAKRASLRAILSDASNVAYWRVAVAHLAENDHELKESLEALLLTWVQHRISSLSTAAGVTAVPVGWLGRAGGHSIFALIARQSASSFSETLVNSGIGTATYHEGGRWVFTKRDITSIGQTCVGSKVDILRHLEEMMSLDNSGAFSQFLREPDASAEQQTTKSALELHYNFGKEPSRQHKPCSVFGAGQIPGNCTVEGLKRVVRHVLPPDDYKRWVTEAKFIVMATWFPHLKSFGAGVESRQQMTKLLTKCVYTRLLFSRRPIKEITPIFLDLINDRPLMGRLVERTIERAASELDSKTLSDLVLKIGVQDLVYGLECITRIIETNRNVDAEGLARELWERVGAGHEIDNKTEKEVVDWLKRLDYTPPAVQLIRYSYLKDSTPNGARRLRQMNAIMEKANKLPSQGYLVNSMPTGSKHRRLRSSEFRLASLPSKKRR